MNRDNGEKKPEDVKQIEYPFDAPALLRGIDRSLADLSKQISCDHAGLKGEHAALFEMLAEINNRLHKMREIESAKEPEPQPETVETPAENETAESDKPTEKTGSGL